MQVCRGGILQEVMQKGDFPFLPGKERMDIYIFDRQYAMITKMIISLKEEVVDEVRLLLLAAHLSLAATGTENATIGAKPFPVLDIRSNYSACDSSFF